MLTAALFLLLGTSCTKDDAQPKPRFSWQETPASLALRNGGKVLWQFNHLQDGEEKGCPYFHPLATIDGAVLTDLRPGGHRWHRGLRFAWRKINGVEGYWTWPEGQQNWPEKELGRTKVTAVKIDANDDFSARFELEVSYHPPGAPADLTEKRIIEVSSPDQHGNYQIDWHGVFTAGSRGAFLDRTPIPGEEGGRWWGGYAGLQFRVAPRDQYSAWAMTNSEGISVAGDSKSGGPELHKQLSPLHGKPARWMNLTLTLADGKTGGITLMDHPANLRHPSPWHVSAMPHEFHHAPLFSGPFTVEAGKPMPFRFRIVVHSNLFRKSDIERQWNDFSSSTIP
jgi:hypothetical protein